MRINTLHKLLVVVKSSDSTVFLGAGPVHWHCLTATPSTVAGPAYSLVQSQFVMTICNYQKSNVTWPRPVVWSWKSDFGFPNPWYFHTMQSLTKEIRKGKGRHMIFLFATYWVALPLCSLCSVSHLCCLTTELTVSAVTPYQLVAPTGFSIQSLFLGSLIWLDGLIY